MIENQKGIEADLDFNLRANISLKHIGKERIGSR